MSEVSNDSTKGKGKIKRDITIHPYWIHPNERHTVNMEAYKHEHEDYAIYYKYPEIQYILEQLSMIVNAINENDRHPRESMIYYMVNGLLMYIDHNMTTAYEDGLPEFGISRS